MFISVYILWLWSADFFQNKLFQKKFFQEHYRSVKWFHHFVGLDLVPELFDTLMVFLKEFFQNVDF